MIRVYPETDEERSAAEFGYSVPRIRRSLQEGLPTYGTFESSKQEPTLSRALSVTAYVALIIVALSFTLYFLGDRNAL